MKTITRAEYLETVQWAWTTVTLGKQFLIEIPVGVLRVVATADDLDFKSREDYFTSVEAAIEYARNQNLSRYKATLPYLRGLTKTVAILAKSKKRREKAKTILASTEKFIADLEAGTTAIKVEDIKPYLRVSASIPVGTNLWVASANDCFGKGPAVLHAKVIEVNERGCLYHDENDNPYQDMPDISYIYTVSVEKQPGGGALAEGAYQTSISMDLPHETLPVELPWRVSDERLFTSRAAAEEALADLGRRLLVAAGR